jgi:hypothetical protein
LREQQNVILDLGPRLSRTTGCIAVATGGLRPTLFASRPTILALTISYRGRVHREIDDRVRISEVPAIGSANDPAPARNNHHWVLAGDLRICCQRHTGTLLFWAIESTAPGGRRSERCPTLAMLHGTRYNAVTIRVHRRSHDRPSAVNDVRAADALRRGDVRETIRSRRDDGGDVRSTRTMRGPSFEAGDEFGSRPALDVEVALGPPRATAVRTAVVAHHRRKQGWRAGGLAAVWTPVRHFSPGPATGGRT